MDSDRVNNIDDMNKEFEEWFNKTHAIKSPDGVDMTLFEFNRDCQYFYKLPFSFQWGVYLEFFDSKNIIITVDLRDGLFYEIVVFEYIQGEYSKLPHSFHTTRTEAQQEAIKKAFKILKK